MPLSGRSKQRGATSEGLRYNGPMELALATLLVSSLTSIGLLALWAATSPRHWFLRTAVFLGVVSLLLLIPAYEPWVAFVLQGAVVVRCWRNCRFSLDESERGAQPTRFSLATLLQLMVILAVFAAVGSKLPALNYLSWRSVVVIGLTSGLTSLLAYRLIQVKRPTLWLRIVLGACFACALAFVLGIVDLLAVSILSRSGWPFEETFMAVPWLEEASTGWLWLSVVFGQLLLTGLVLLLLPTVFRTTDAREMEEQRVKNEGNQVHFLGGALLTFFITLPTAYTYWELIHPLPIPEADLPNPNGYDDLQAAWAILPAKSLVDGMNFDAEKNPLTQVSNAVDKARPALIRARKGIAKPCMHLLDYSGALDQVLPDIQNARSLARAFEAEGVLAKRRDDIAGALKSRLDLVAYGYAMRRGRMIIGELVGMACAGIGRRGIYDLRETLDIEQAEPAIRTLTEILEDAEPHEDFIYRDKVWTQQSQGWYGRLTLLLEKFSGDDPWSFISVDSAVLRENTEMRLLIAELAVRAHVLQHGQPPAQMAEVESLPSGKLPVDPFSPEGAPLGYVREGDSYLLYSVGPNRIDENGASPDPNDVIYKNFETGDFRLDLFYAPDEDPNAGE